MTDGDLRIHIDYGREGLDVTLPAGLEVYVLDHAHVAPLADPGESIAESLRRPIGALPLAEAARGKHRCCVVISDKTRPVPNRAILPRVFEALNAAGVRDDEITILIGTGIHALPTKGEIEEILGEDLPQRYRVVAHDARNAASNVSIGRTSEGIEVFVDRTYIESDFRIVTGLIEPHFMAGYSGGRKGVCPAVCSYDTVKHFHSVSRLSHPKSWNGYLDGNPVHEMALEVAQMVGVDFLVNVTLDMERRVTGVFAGHLVDAHRAGVEFLRSYAVARVAEPVDIVITTNAGYPLDATFYQANKAMMSAWEIAGPGATVIVAAQCGEGEGGKEFVDLMNRIESPDQIMGVLRTPGFYQIDQWGIQEMCRALERYEIFFICDTVAHDRLRRCGLVPFDSVDAALSAALAKHGAKAKVAVIPRGSYIEARVAGKDS